MIADSYPLSVDATGALSSFVERLTYDLLPIHTVNNAQLFFLDYVASVHAGYRVNYAINSVMRDIALGGSGRGAAHVFFSGVSRAPLDAAFVNAFYAHGADLDDGNKLAAGHIGAHVISSLMALAEERGASFSRFYEALIAGYEVFCRLSSACMPHLVDRGFHSTGTAGCLASAAACSKLLGLRAEGVANAISLSATQASGLLLAGETRQDMKAVNPANAARAGMLSALLAEKGVAGPIKPLESDKGWCHAMTPLVDLDRLIGGLGDYFCIDQSYLKPYPSCRHTHCVIEAALRLRKSVDLYDVSAIDIETYGHAIDLAGRVDMPRTTGEAKFSIKYAAIIALCRGRFGLEDLELENIGNLEKCLMERTRLVLNDSYEQPSRGIRGAKVSVRTKGGLSFAEEVLIPKGDPENPFTLKDVEEKLRYCFSDSDGCGIPEMAAVFLGWYRPIMKSLDKGFVFPQYPPE